MCNIAVMSGFDVCAILMCVYGTGTLQIQDFFRNLKLFQKLKTACIIAHQTTFGF